ncbi:MAG: nucleotide-diphosphate-sugar epimerase [Betaproteobacteria bacterium]|nr:MAG: nucleotide-diphosphate-sugar epimerase [Betaproteobacteria bacterium]
MSQIVTVFGATGAQGGGVARAALADPAQRFRVRAVTRKPDAPAAKALRDAGAEVVAADLDDPASVGSALRGADAAFCVTSFWEHFSPERELAQARAMAEAAAAAGVKHVVWSTLEDTRRFVPPGTPGWKVLGGRFNVPHFDAKGEADAFFAERGVPTTRLLTSFYWENLIHFGMQPQRGADGVLQFVLPMGEARLPGIAVEDIGGCAYAVLARGAEFAGRAVGIAGEHLSGGEMARQLSEALGERVRHVSPTFEQYAAFGFPGADDLANMFRFNHDFAREFCAARDVAATRALHPRLQSFAAWLAANAKRIPVEPTKG